MSVELWLIRHGETEWSLSGAHTSVTDIPLTQNGRDLAAHLKTYLHGRPFAAVLTSPMQRARETCALAGYGDQAQIEENLREWNYGESEGKTTQEMRQKYGPTWSVWTDPIVGCESVEQVGERADKVIARALAAVQTTSQSRDVGNPDDEGEAKSRSFAPPTMTMQEGGAVALFAHAHILRILAARWIGLDAVGGRLFALGTGAVSVLSFERETRVVKRWNLEAGIRD